jgi:hypothetical protein
LEEEEEENEEVEKEKSINVIDGKARKNETTRETKT